MTRRNPPQNNHWYIPNAFSSMSEAERRAMRRALASLGVTFFILAFGTAGYLIIDEGRHSALDCLFMAFITVATIGYGETIPLTTNSAKLFTMLVGGSGVANMAFLTSAIVAWIVELETNPLRKRNAMEKRIAKLSGHYIVCGMGRAGTRIVRELSLSNAEYVAMDVSEEKLEGHQLHVKGDASDEDALEAANIGKAAGVFAVTGDDAKNLMITLAARELAPNSRIVARSSDERNAKRMSKSGANATICPDIAAGAKLASAMLTPHAHGFIDELALGGNASLIEASVGDSEDGITLAEFLASRNDVSAMALFRNEQWNVALSSNQKLSKGDVLIMLSTPKNPSV